MMQQKSRSIGFPIMREEAGEKRAFLPHFIQQMVKIGFEVYLEDGYGSTLDFVFEDYEAENDYVHKTSREEAFKKEYVLILRSPHDEEFDLLGSNSCLISMLHFPTHPLRRQLLKKKKIQAISLDSIVNDFNVRLVENMQAVAWNGLETAFGEFIKDNPNLIRADRQPWHVLIIGTGMVGKQAADAATKFGRTDWNDTHIHAGGQGVIATSIGRNITSLKDRMLALMADNHIIVDCTQRRDASKPVIPNDWLAACTQEAVIVDLSVDPYSLEADPPVVKGIEGIPQGNLDQYVFDKDDPAWDKTVPDEIPSKNRRKTISCYSWPGIFPKKCMRVYGQQLLPLMRVLTNKDYQTLSPEGPHFERALYRAKLDTYLEQSRMK